MAGGIWGPVALLATLLLLGSTLARDDSLSAASHPGYAGSYMSLNGRALLRGMSPTAKLRKKLKDIENAKEDDQGQESKKCYDRCQYLNKRLLKAAGLGFLSNVKSILENGADPNSLDSYGETPLFKASSKGYAEVVAVLLEAGADPDLQERGGRTALIEASSWNYTDVVRLLLKAGAQPNFQDNYGDTALILAARDGETAIVSLLLDAGADQLLENNDGRTALQLAKEQQHTAVIRHLVSEPSG